VQTPGIPVRDVPHQEGDILGPLAQGRDVNGKHVHPIIEVAAARPRGHYLRQIPVGRRHQAHVHADGPRAAHALEGLLLQHPQQLGLQCQRQVPDLVEEEHPLVRQLKAPGFARQGAREGAALMAEDLALREPRGKGGAVHRDESAVSAALAPLIS